MSSSRPRRLGGQGAGSRHGHTLRAAQARPFAAPGLVLVLLFGVPILVTLVTGLGNNFLVFVRAPEALAALRLSLVTSTAALFATVLLGTPLAYFFALTKFPGRWLLELIVDLPIVLPPAVAGLALLMTFGRRGFLGSALGQLGLSLPFTTWAVILAQIFVAAPFFVRAARVGFAAIDVHLAESALVEGASPWQLFVLIMLPLARRALITGLILAWTRALGEFGATILFAGNLEGVSQTMPLAIYIGFEQNSNSALALAVTLIALSALLMTGLRRLEDHDD